MMSVNPFFPGHRRGRKLVAQPVTFTARYDPNSAAVSLLLSGRAAFAQGGRIVLNAAPPSGIADASGVPLAGKTIFDILPGLGACAARYALLIELG